MRYAALLIVSLMVGCAPLPAQRTITIVKTVPQYPPAALYSEDGDCRHAPERTSGTVRDLSVSLIYERAAVDACRGDRAALRQWAKDGK